MKSLWLSKKLLDGITSGTDTVFRSNLVADLAGSLRVARIAEKDPKSFCHPACRVVLPIESPRDPKILNPEGIVRLVMRERDDQHGTTSPKRLPNCADPALMDNCRGMRKEVGERSVFENPDVARNRPSGPVIWTGSNQQDGSESKLFHRLKTLLIEVAGSAYC